MVKDPRTTKLGKQLQDGFVTDPHVVTQANTLGHLQGWGLHLTTFPMKKFFLKILHPGVTPTETTGKAALRLDLMILELFPNRNNSKTP